MTAERVSYGFAPEWEKRDINPREKCVSVTERLSEGDAAKQRKKEEKAAAQR